MGPAHTFESVSRRPPDVEDYIDMLRRYRSWIIGPTFAGLVIATVVAFLWPDTYISTAVMRITPQQVPEKFVPSAVSSQMADRLQQMQTDILSRTSLAEIIQKPSLDLYKKERNKLPMEDIVQDMRNKYIHITPLARWRRRTEVRLRLRHLLHVHGPVQGPGGGPRAGHQVHRAERHGAAQRRPA